MIWIMVMNGIRAVIDDHPPREDPQKMTMVIRPILEIQTSWFPIFSYGFPKVFLRFSYPWFSYSFHGVYKPIYNELGGPTLHAES